MQRRHAIIAAIALVALVLIPAAALAAGAGGFGHRGGPGPGNVSRPDGAPAWDAGHPNWTPGDGPGNRTLHGNATCAANLSCDRGAPGAAGNATIPACDGARIGNPTAPNRTAADENGPRPGPQGRDRRGPGR